MLREVELNLPDSEGMKYQDTIKIIHKIIEQEAISMINIKYISSKFYGIKILFYIVIRLKIFSLPRQVNCINLIAFNFSY